MSRQSPWDCPFCGRMSAETPDLRRQPHSHFVETAGNSNSGIFRVKCWYCGATGPLSAHPAEAIRRWQYVAEKDGAPKW